MMKFQDVIVRNSGSDQGVVPVEGASVLVQSYPGAVNSTLYSDDGITPKTNPLTTDSEGRFSFYAADGRYQLVISGALIANQTITDLLLEDPEDGSVGVFSDLTATNSFTLSAMTQGSILFAGVGGLVSQDNANLSFNDATNALSVGGAVSAGTQVMSGNGSLANPAFGFTNFPTSGFSVTNTLGTPAIVLGPNGAAIAAITANSDGIAIRASNPLSWSSNVPGTNTSDLYLFRDTADVLAQRRGANAQTIRVYNTFTDAANYERARFEWNGGIFRITTQQAGTGVARALLIGTDGNNNILFQQNGAVSWFMSGTVGLGTQNDNAIDIGASGVSRPRTAYLGTSIQVGTNPSTAGAINLANAANISARNAANSADVQMIRLSASDNVLLSPAGGADIQWGKALVALGGGSVPTLGTIGGTGPATAAQNTWMRVIDSTGAAFWVPAWK